MGAKGRVEADERLEESGQVLRLDPDSGIFHRNLDELGNVRGTLSRTSRFALRTVHCAGSDHNPPADWGELHVIRQEVEEDLIPQKSSSSWTRAMTTSRLKIPS